MTSTHIFIYNNKSIHSTKKEAPLRTPIHQTTTILPQHHHVTTTTTTTTIAMYHPIQQTTTVARAPIPSQQTHGNSPERADDRQKPSHQLRTANLHIEKQADAGRKRARASSGRRAPFPPRAAPSPHLSSRNLRLWGGFFRAMLRRAGLGGLGGLVLCCVV